MLLCETSACKQFCKALVCPDVVQPRVGLEVWKDRVGRLHGSSQPLECAVVLASQSHEFVVKDDGVNCDPSEEQHDGRGDERRAFCGKLLGLPMTRLRTSAPS